MTETATTPAQIYGLMNAVMVEVGAVKKKDVNQHFKFSFRGIDAVVNAVSPALQKHGVIVTPTVENVTYEKVTVNGKPATQCLVQMAYTFYAPDGSWVRSSVIGEAIDSGDKATPKAMSIAFRTALLQSFVLPTDDPDPDSFSPQQEATPMATPEQFKAIGAAFIERGTTDANQKAEFVASVVGRQTSGADLTYAEAGILLAKIKEAVDQEKAEANLTESLGAEEIKADEA